MQALTSFISWFRRVCVASPVGPIEVEWVVVDQLSGRLIESCRDFAAIELVQTWIKDVQRGALRGLTLQRHSIS
jgi:hypothetical protein